MIVCSHCYELVSEEFREKDEICPFCFHILPEPEPVEEEAPVMEAAPAAPIRAYGVADMSGAHVDPTIYEPEKKSKTTIIAIALIAIIALAGGGWFMFGRSSGSTEGGKKKKVGLDPKLVAALKRLDTEVDKKVEAYFKKTCEIFQQKGYTHRSQFNYDNNEVWRSIIEPGDGSPTSNEDWYQCPIKLADIRAKSNLTLKIKVRYAPPPDLFSQAKRWLKVIFEGSPVKPYSDWETPSEKEIYVHGWEKAKEKFTISAADLYKGPKVMKDITGRHDYKIESKALVISIGKNTLKQTDKNGPNNDFGTFEATAPGWFGETFTKYIKDWGTGCSNDINEQFKKARQAMIDKRDDLELFADDPRVVGYMSLADKAGNKLCSAMVKAYKIIQLHDEGKASEAESLKVEFEKELKEAKKALRTDLPQYIQNLK